MDADIRAGERRVDVLHTIGAHHSYHAGQIAFLRQLLRVVPGHGAVGDRGLLRDQRTYVGELLAAVRDAQARGLTLDTARPTLELGAFSRRLLYDLVHPSHVQLAWDEMAPRVDPVVALRCE